MVDTLGDGLAVPRDGDGALGGVGQHLAGHLDGGARHLADLLDLGAALADEAAALRGGHDQPEGDRGPGDRVGSHEVREILEKKMEAHCIFWCSWKRANVPRRGAKFESLLG